MPSVSWQRWSTLRLSKLDEIEHAHGLIGGKGRGRRYATQQINQAYTVLLSSQFQAYCRDLHSECIDHLIINNVQSNLESIICSEFLLHRKLDTGNPNQGNIGADFNRLGITLWPTIENHDKQNRLRRIKLEELNDWRNAIAHQDFDSQKFAGKVTIQLQIVRRWRRALTSLAASMDEVMRQYLHRINGASPW